MNAEYINAGVVTFVAVDATGRLTGMARVKANVADAHAAACPTETALLATEAAKLTGGFNFTLANGTIAAAAPIAPAITELQTQARAKVDAMAEMQRLKLITVGTGQSQEYFYTEADVNAINAASDPLTESLYPWVAAELNAQIAAGNTTMTLRQAAALCAAKIANWKTFGAALKQTRRTAKLKIAAATTADQITAIMAGITWPTPPTS